MLALVALVAACGGSTTTTTLQRTATTAAPSTDTTAAPDLTDTTDRFRHHHIRDRVQHQNHQRSATSSTDGSGSHDRRRAEKKALHAAFAALGGKIKRENPVEVVTGDAQGPIRQPSTWPARWLEQDKVVAIIGPPDSGRRMGVAKQHTSKAWDPGDNLQPVSVRDLPGQQVGRSSGGTTR